MSGLSGQYSDYWLTSVRIIWKLSGWYRIENVSTIWWFGFVLQILFENAVNMYCFMRILANIKISHWGFFFAKNRLTGKFLLILTPPSGSLQPQSIKNTGAPVAIVVKTFAHALLPYKGRIFRRSNRVCVAFARIWLSQWCCIVWQGMWMMKRVTNLLISAGPLGC